jgi:hypothetical protein
MAEPASIRRVPSLTPPPRAGASARAEPRHFPWAVVGLLLIAFSMAFYAWKWTIDAAPVGAALVMIPLVTLFTVPTMVRAARGEPTFDLAGLMLVSLGLRFAFAYYRMTHAFDAVLYHQWGVKLAAQYRAFNFGASPGSQVPGTGGMRVVSGIIHVLVNDDYFAAYLLMGWLGFWGCWFIYRAAVTAVPDLKRYRYARLLFLWPSFAYWLTSIGKDSWMVFTVGLATLGAARVFRRESGGYTMALIGLFLGSFVRPHLCLVALLAFIVALLLGRRQNTANRMTPASIAKVAALVLLLAFSTVLVARTQKLLRTGDFSTGLNQTQVKTAVGNSAFKAPKPLTPIGYPEALVTVLFRPFPFEAHGMEQLVTAAEGVLLIVLSIASYKGLLSILRRIRTQPFVTYCAVYVLIWAAVFGIISNFGILERQRSTMLPFYFVLLCLPAIAPTSRTERWSVRTTSR